VALAAVLASLAILLVLAGMAVGNESLIIWAAGVSFAVLPLALGAAVARYRLYDLDRIVSRTLAYGLLTALLGGGYAYDAARTIAAFSWRRRQQVDLDTLAAELLAVVDQPMQPASASLWLRPPTDRAQPLSPIGN
jgi:hypothetical protein